MYEYVSRPDHRRSDLDRLVRRLRPTDDTSASDFASTTASASASASASTTVPASAEVEWRRTPTPTPAAIRGQL